MDATIVIARPISELSEVPETGETSMQDIVKGRSRESQGARSEGQGLRVRVAPVVSQ